MYYRCAILILLGIFSHFALHNSLAKPHDFETTRMKSTAGAGVGSILLDESVVLNPAPIALFNISSIYLQMVNNNTQGNDNGASASSAPNNQWEETQRMVIISDTTGNIKGALSYQDYNYLDQKRQRISSAIGKALPSGSAVGMGLRYTKDEFQDQGQLKKDDYTQLSFGVTHILSPSFSLGAVIFDPLKEVEGDNRFTLGAQYLYKDFIALMLDVGSDYNDDLSKRVLYRGAIQFKFFKDLYLRFGAYRDRYLGEKGNGVGLSWVGPKLSFDLAMKNIQESGPNQSARATRKKAQETAFSMSYFF